MAESTLSERRQTLPFEVFRELLKRMLRPIVGADAAASYRGLRLVAIDGVSFSLPNTEQVKRACKKGGNQRGRAAFAKLQCAALVELLMHNPLAAMLSQADSLQLTGPQADSLATMNRWYIVHLDSIEASHRERRGGCPA